MLNLYKFHTNPESLEQRGLGLQLEQVVEYIKDMFEHYYDEESYTNEREEEYSISYKFVQVDEDEVKFKVILTFDDNKRFGIIQIYNSYNNDIIIKTLVNSRLIDHESAINNRAKLNEQAIMEAVRHLVYQIAETYRD
jgi:hypothetical protein